MLTCPAGLPNPSLHSAHKACIPLPQVITDPGTQRSKGYGFVRFSVEADRDRALHEMQGCFISSRAIRVSLATAKRGAPPGPAGMGSGPAAPTHMGGGGGGHRDTGDWEGANTTLFIGGLSATVTEDQLRSLFCRYGEIIYTKIPQGKGCGFVQFVDRKAAEGALREMNGQSLGGSSMRISWGRSSTKATMPHPPGPGGGGAARGFVPPVWGRPVPSQLRPPPRL